jgi:hypothetical protein
MDKLEKAKWFTSLYLNARYHQVRLKLGEEFKTAFLRTRSVPVVDG